MIAGTPSDVNLAWIQRTFKKRECIKYIPSKVDYHSGRCSCGKFLHEHDEQVQRTAANEMNFLAVQREERWSVQKHTRCDLTDAFGTIEFEGMAHPTKAQVRERKTRNFHRSFAC